MILRFLIGLLLVVVIIVMLPSAAFIVGMLAYLANVVMR
jgi:hypothetical protein